MNIKCLFFGHKWIYGRDTSGLGIEGMDGTERVCSRCNKRQIFKVLWDFDRTHFWKSV